MSLASDRSSARTTGYALVALAAVGWGTWPYLLRRAESYGPIPAATESALVMAIIMVASAPAWLLDRIRERATLSQWIGVVWLGIGDALNVVLFFAAYRATSVAIAVLTHYLTPLFVALTAPLVLREPWRARTFVATGTSFAGLVLLLGPWNAHAGPNDALGAALGAGSAVFYASNVLVNKRLTSVFSGSELMFFHAVVATPLLIAIAYFTPGPGIAALHAKSIVLLSIGGLFPGTLSGLLFVWGLRRIAASHASVLALLEPVVALMIGAALLGEPVGSTAILGGVLVLAGAGLVVTRASGSPVADRR